MNPKKRAIFHEYVLTTEAKVIKQGFVLKSEGNYTNRGIMEKMKSKGVIINEKSFRNIISNPFYAGYVTGNLVDGKLIKGHHPAIIDLKTFLKANEILAKASNANVAEKFYHEQLPLRFLPKTKLPVINYRVVKQRATGTTKPKAVLSH